MHVLIINGSPRVKEYSNTDKILEKFTKGMCENGTTFEQYEVSDVKQWEKMREAYYNNSKILIALPLYVECIPGLLLEFLETLEPKNDGTGMAFILQSGFAEGIQLRCGESYLEILAGKLEETESQDLTRKWGVSFRKTEISGLKHARDLRARRFFPHISGL